MPHPSKEIVLVYAGRRNLPRDSRESLLLHAILKLAGAESPGLTQEDMCERVSNGDDFMDIIAELEKMGCVESELGKKRGSSRTERLYRLHPETEVTMVITKK